MKYRVIAGRGLAVFALVWFAASCVESTNDSVSGVATGTESGTDAPPDETPDPLEPTVGYPAGLPYNAPESPDDDVIDEGNFDAEPVILSTEPTTAEATGGTTVTIRGENFQPGATVWFGDTLGENVFYINDQFINVDTPIISPGVVDVAVENPDGGYGALEDAFTFTADLELTSVEPSEGHVSGGETVTLTGVGFDENVRVLFGGRLAMSVTVVDLFTLEAVTPAGTVGLEDVRIFVEGDAVAELERSFRYVGPPTISAVEPPAAPAVGGTLVTLVGSQFGPDLSVTFDGKPAEVIEVSGDASRVTVRVPGGAVGPADVTVETEDGEDVLLDGFAWTQPSDSLGIVHVTPPTGALAGGTPVSLILAGHSAAEPSAVSFGGVAANVLTSTTDGVVVAIAPPGEAGAVDVIVTHRGQTTVRTDGYVYDDPFAVTAITPAFGSAAGGDVRVVWGTLFDQLDADDITVEIGGVAAPVVELESGDGQITLAIQTPPCSVGPNDVVVRSGSSVAVLTDGFDCLADTAAVYAADPSVVAQSGGTLVKLIGASLPENAVVTVDGVVAPVVERESQVALWIRAPRGEVGPADIRITSPELKAPLELTGGILYRDPTNPNAGIWGEVIDGAVNVSVFDGQGNGPILNALAILGSDPATQEKCLTDDRGQCVISKRRLTGPLTITINKFQYSAYTIAGFTGRDVTVFIRAQSPPAQTGPPGAGGGGGPPPAPINSIIGTISGEVKGLGKYVQPPAPDCSVLGSPDGQQCTECNQEVACPGDLTCTPIADTGSWCVKACESDIECGDGYVCSPTGYGARCVPFTGSVVARCQTSRRSFFGSNPDPGPGFEVTPDDPNYLIESRPGEVTVYCTAGYTHPITGVFIATRMGIRQTVLVYIDEETTDVDVELDIPLTRTLRMRVFDLPEHEAGIGIPFFRNALDLGAEGWIEFPSQPAGVTGEMRLFPGYPESLTPFGPDAAMTFYSWVNPNASGNIPSSYYLAHKLKSVDGDPLSVRAPDGEWDSELSGMRGDLHAVWAVTNDDVWAVGPNGRIVHKGPLGWDIQPQFTDADLHGLWGSAADALWAVGESGTILRFDGVTWTKEPTSEPIAWTIRAIDGEWAVGDGGILRRENGIWTVQPVLHSGGLMSVRVVGDRVIAVGLAGKVLTYEGGSWTADLPIESGEMLRAVWGDGGGIYAVGDKGLVLFQGANGEWKTTHLSARDFYAVTGDQSSVWVAGTVGTVWRLDRFSGEWTEESNPDLARVDLRTLTIQPEGLRAAGTTALPFGPWMAFAEPVNPYPFEILSPGTVEWSYRHENPVPTYNTMYLNSNDGYNLWTIIAAGPLSKIHLPPLEELTGWNPILDGTKYMSFTRSLTPEFSMGGYRFNQLSMWRRTTWSSLYGNFY